MDRCDSDRHPKWVSSLSDLGSSMFDILSLGFPSTSGNQPSLFRCGLVHVRKPIIDEHPDISPRKKMQKVQGVNRSIDNN